MITWGFLQGTGVACLQEKDKMFVVRSAVGVTATELDAAQKNVVFIIPRSCLGVSGNPQGFGCQSGTICY